MMAKKKNTYQDKINKRLAKEDFRNITFRIPVELLDEFKETCEEEELKMNHVVIEMIKDYLGKS